MGLNGVLCGLVSITANCQLVEPWHAIIIGFVGSILLFMGHFLLKKLRIDDPCDATVVHGFCGVWGLWAAGIFCIDSNVQYAAYPNVNNACQTGEQFGVQVVGSLAIFAWTIGVSAIMFLCIKFSVGVRITSEAEDVGLDMSEHGIYDGVGIPLASAGSGKVTPGPQEDGIKVTATSNGLDVSDHGNLGPFSQP